MHRMAKLAVTLQILLAALVALAAADEQALSSQGRPRALSKVKQQGSTVRRWTPGEVDAGVVSHRLRQVDRPDVGALRSDAPARKEQGSGEQGWPPGDVDAAVVKQRLRKVADLGGSDALAREAHKAPVITDSQRRFDSFRERQRLAQERKEQAEENKRQLQSEQHQEGRDAADDKEEEADANYHPRESGDAFALAMEEQQKLWRAKWHGRSLHEEEGEEGEQPAGRDAAPRQRQPRQKGFQQRGQADQLQPPPLPQHIPIIDVALMTAGMAAAAGLGALPFFFVRSLSRRWSALATAIACGVMFAASFDLVHEGQPFGGNAVVVGILMGGVFISAMQRWLDGMEEVRFGSLQGASARRMLLMVGIMAAHAVGEGCGVGVSFVGERGWAQGVLTTLAIGVHNIPEGLAKATVLVSQGASAPQALVWSIVTCLPQPLVAVPAFLFVETFSVLLPVALGFAAGCMIWMVFAELLPDALKEAPSGQVATVATLSAAGLEGVRMALESLEGPGGVMRAPLSGSGDVLWPALVALAPAVAAATAGGVLVGRSGLPTPLLLGFAATASAACGLAPLLQQLLWQPAVPLLHTLSGAGMGAAAALLLRRQLLSSNSGAAGKRADTNGQAGAGAKEHSDVEGAWGGSANGCDYFGGAATGVGGAAGAYSGVYSRRTESAEYAVSPSKAKALHGGSKVLMAHDSKSERRWSGPARAAGMVTAAALLVQAVALGWHLALSMLRGEAIMHVMPPALLALGLRGLAAGGAARAMAGRAGSSGAWLGAIIGLLGAGAAALAAAGAPVDEDNLAAAFSYPQGLNETLGAVAAGAVGMGALMLLAVGMGMHPQRARLGVIVAVVLVGAVGGSLFVACHMLGSHLSCHTLAVLQ